LYSEVVFAGHAVHAADPAAEYRLMPQVAHEDAPVAEWNPAGQGVQVSSW
jgi:hypothetical protein